MLRDRTVAPFRNSVSGVRSQVSRVMCHVSSVTYHMSLTPTATAFNPSPANSPTMTAVWFAKTPPLKKQKKVIEKNKLNFEQNLQILEPLLFH